MATLMMRVNAVANNGGLGHPGPLAPWDWVILVAVSRRFRNRPRGFTYEIGSLQDASDNGSKWRPSYPPGKIVAAVMCDIRGLWR